MDDEELDSMSMRWTTGIMHKGTENQQLHADHCTASSEEENVGAVDEMPAGADKGQAHERQEMVCQASATASTSQESEMMHSVTRVETTVDMEEFDSLEAPHVEVCISLVQRTTRLVYIHLLAY